MSPPHTAQIEEIVSALSTDISFGLTAEEARKRLKIYGRNELREPESNNPLLILIAQFKNPLAALLLAAAFISFTFNDYPEFVAILIVILINALMGFILELQAHRSMRALKRLEKKWVKVFRNGQLMILESGLVVPGDILFIEAGDVASADGRIVESTQLEVNQSMLTGESLPVPKNKYLLKSDTILAERANMFYKGTSATRGNCKLLVIGTGMNTEMGKISDLLEVTEKVEVPLTAKLNRLSYRLVWFTLCLIFIVIAIGYITGKELYLMVETALALAVAAIPEGLPIVATIALAKGMFKMAKHKVLVKKLAAVETLGGTDLIMTDKTGTLTENKLEVHRLSLGKSDNDYLVEGGRVRSEYESMSMQRLLQVAALCNNGSIQGSEDGVGDPLETALLRFVSKQNISLFNVISQYKRYYEKVFDSESRIMITGHFMPNNHYFLSIKGGPVEVLDKCTKLLENKIERELGENEISLWKEKIDRLASEGLKILGFGFKLTDSEPEEHVSSFTFIGLVGLIDPPKVEVPDAVSKCHEAGIKVVMVTGDHSETAKAIALKIGLTSDLNEKVVRGIDLVKMDLAATDTLKDTLIYSRVNPAQKLALVEYYQDRGNVLAMTGDGVNDAPALRKADIGIAMGLRGTDVAREAADMVLQDDSFSSIAYAVRQGRIIINNIKNFVIYLLSCNLSEILIVGLAAFSNMVLPLLPLQILFLNLVTDVFPALALGMGGGNAGIMKGKFRDSNEPIITSADWKAIAGYAFVLTATVLGVYVFSLKILHFSNVLANNIAFYTLAFAQLMHPLNLIKKSDSIFKNEIVSNPHLWLAIVFCSILMILAYWLPPIREALDIGYFDFEAIVLIAVGSFIPVVAIRLLKKIA